MTRKNRLRAVVAALSVAVAGLWAGSAPAPAAPIPSQDGPGVGTPWVVSLGDSYISGEAGRWAGNTNQSSSKHDALGSTAYFDNASNTGETQYKCHRSKSAEIHIGGGVNSLNLACSGAKTTTSTSSDGVVRPGIDFYDDGTAKGQALLLQEFAATHNVKMVEISIGGNDFQFADTLMTCGMNWYSSPTWWKNYCYDDTDVANRVSASYKAARQTDIANAYVRVRTAMRNAGYADSQWTLLVRNDPSPLPRGSGIRYSESGYSRYNTGGCPVWNRDADWLNDQYLPAINNAITGAIGQSGLTNTKTLNVSTALNGRRICETGVGLYEEVGLASWTSAGAVDRTEWVNTIRIFTTAGDSPYFLQESAHPNYWAQLAFRSCVRQAWNGGTVRGGTCTRSGTGLTSLGEPRMTLQ